METKFKAFLKKFMEDTLLEERYVTLRMLQPPVVSEKDGKMGVWINFNLTTQKDGFTITYFGCEGWILSGNYYALELHGFTRCESQMFTSKHESGTNWSGNIIPNLASTYNYSCAMKPIFDEILYEMI